MVSRKSRKIHKSCKISKIGIYAGSGTSHSWLWFVDLFEKAGFINLVFLDELSVQNNEIKDLDVLVISGGDTFAVAYSLGKKGGQNIKTFVEKGGVYIGSCAGAYLPMKSSKAPLDLFNFVDVKITNLSKFFPGEETQTCQSCAAYGYDFVFHPVREAMSLKTTSFFDNNKKLEFNAPLYGGPGMKAHDPSWVLAEYQDFTPKTSFFTSRKIAEKTLIGNGAVIRVPFEKGCFYLLGPHLEHPKFKDANQFIIDAVVKETDKSCEPVNLKTVGQNPGELESDFLKTDNQKTIKPNNYEANTTLNEKLTGKDAKKLLLSIRRELSNSRIVAGSLEFLSIQWLIGQKMYQPQKIRVYLESMWKRQRALEKNREIILKPGLYDTITNTAAQITIELRSIKQQIDKKQDSLETATIIFDLLHVLSISFYDLYFATISNGRQAKV